MCAKWLQSCLTLYDPMDCIACQAPLSIGFSWQDYWSGLPCPPPGDLPDPGIKLLSHVSCTSRQVLYHRRHLGSPNRLCHLFSARTQRILKRLMILKGYEYLYARGICINLMETEIRKKLESASPGNCTENPKDICSVAPPHPLMPSLCPQCLHTSPKH